MGSVISIFVSFLILRETGLTDLCSASAFGPLVERLLFLVCFFADGSTLSCVAGNGGSKTVDMVRLLMRLLDLVFLRLLTPISSWSSRVEV